MPQFKINWRDVLRVSKDVVSGMTEEQAQSTLTNERPMLVFVYDSDVEGERYLVEETKEFLDDQVAVGARFFDCLRIDVEGAKTDRALARAFKRTPALVFLRPDFSVHKVLTGKLSSKKIFAAMCSTTQQDYETCVKTAFKKQDQISKERGKLSKDWAAIQKLDDAIADEANQRKRAKLVKERDALLKKVGDIEAKLDAEEAKLYELAPKAEKKTA